MVPKDDNRQVGQPLPLIASTRNGGVDWLGPEETTTNFRYQYVQSQRLEAGRYLLLLRNELLEIREN